MLLQHDDDGAIRYSTALATSMRIAAWKITSNHKVLNDFITLKIPVHNLGQFPYLKTKHKISLVPICST